MLRKMWGIAIDVWRRRTPRSVQKRLERLAYFHASSVDFHGILLLGTYREGTANARNGLPSLWTRANTTKKECIMRTVNIWNVEINTLNESKKTTEWRKIGVNLVWYQVLDIKRKYKGFVTRHVKANNRGKKECPACGAFGGHWLSCKSANASAVSKK